MYVCVANHNLPSTHEQGKKRNIWSSISGCVCVTTALSCPVALWRRLQGEVTLRKAIGSTDSDYLVLCVCMCALCTLVCMLCVRWNEVCVVFHCSQVALNRAWEHRVSTVYITEWGGGGEIWPHLFLKVAREAPLSSLWTIVFVFYHQHSCLIKVRAVYLLFTEYYCVCFICLGYNIKPFWLVEWTCSLYKVTKP